MQVRLSIIGGTCKGCPPQVYMYVFQTALDESNAGYTVNP